MKKFIKNTIIVFLILNLILSNLNIGVWGLISLAADGEAIFSYVNIDFIDPDTGSSITEADVNQSTKMEISFGVASDIATETTGIRINLDNSNFYFTSFTPNGDTDKASYKIQNDNGDELTAVLHIDPDGSRYITIDDLVQGSTVHMNLFGYFKDNTSPNEKVTVTVNGVEKASLTANVENKITITNDKTASKATITYHKGDSEDLASNFPIDYKITANVNIPDSWTTEKLTSLEVSDTLTFPSSMYIEYSSGSVDLSNYIGLGENSVLSIEDFSPVISDGKITGIKLNKTITDDNISTYLQNGETISLKYSDGLVVSGDGTISNTVETSYISDNFSGTAEPVTKTTAIDETNGANFENTEKTIANGGVKSSTMTGGKGWHEGYLVEGDEITYQISTKNTGDEKGNVKLTDIIPAGTELVEAKSDNTTDIATTTVTIGDESKDAVIWNFTDVPAGETVTGKITLRIVNDADFKLENSIYKDEKYEESEASADIVDVEKKAPKLEITKTASSSGGTYSNPGDTVTYTITVKNNGTKALESTTVTDTLPDGLDWTTVTADNSAQIDSENGIIVWNDVSLDIGASVTYTVTGTVKDGATGSIENTAVVDKGGSYEKTATAKTEVFDEKTAVGNTGISKEASKEYVSTGETIQYKISLKNSGKKYNIGDLSEKKIVTTDVIPDGISYTEGAYYLLPNDSTQHTEGITYNSETKTITWELTSDVYNTFPTNAVVSLYMPCTVTQKAAETVDTTITNTATSTTLNKTADASVILKKSKGLEIEKYVNKVWNDSGKLIYQSKTHSNTENVNVDFKDDYIVEYGVRVTNLASEDVTLDSTNGSFTDTKNQLAVVSTDSSVKISVYDSKGNLLPDVSVTETGWSWTKSNPFTASSYGDTWTIDMSHFTVPANDYITFTYSLKGSSVSTATNTISNSSIGESKAQDLVNKPEMEKSVAIVAKEDIDKNCSESDLQTYLQSLEYLSETKVSATNLSGKYLLYKIHLDTGSNMQDTYTIEDTISDNLKYVTDLTNIHGQSGNAKNLYGSGPVIAIVYIEGTSWGSTAQYVLENNFDKSRLNVSIDENNTKKNDNKF